MLGMGHVPVHRGSVDAAQSLSSAAEALRQGKVIVLHPEGTVTRDPEWWPMVAKTGVARLALLAPDVPVIPLAQWGVQNSIDLYRKKIKLLPRAVHTITAGQPVDLSAFRDAKPTSETLRAMTDVIMRAVRDEVAELRGISAPTGEFYRWTPSAEPKDAA
jgi:1-acyl-sn-glycerol-3-phosphate acyltransferase